VEVTVDADGDHLVVRIVGGGLMPAQKAFDRGVADTSGSSQRRPFDFALALARALIELNGGVLGVEPADDGRVAMLVRLPAGDSQHSTPPHP
jgi:hypothetical protein